MCQLLAISANTPVDVRLSFAEFRHRGRTNPHGYGFAWWVNGKAQLSKSPLSLSESAVEASRVIEAIRGRVILGHVRLASRGGVSKENTHPFQAQKEGRTFAFAHNGSLTGYKALPLNRLRPRGQTDSERAFLYLLENLPEAGSHGFVPSLKDLADDLARSGTFNFLLSDGETLYAYSDGRLHMTEREAPFGGRIVHLPEEDVSLDLGEVKARGDRAVIVCSEPLTSGEDWSAIPKGALFVFREGRLAAAVAGEIRDL